MRSIIQDKRKEVIRLFFFGYTFDEIVERLGIAKGSVVNIIAEFREGKLPEPVDLVDYIDELRRLAVDLKKHDTSLERMKSYLGLHDRLVEMGINAGEAERCLGICKQIAYSSISNEEFVNAALELGRLTQEHSISYDEVLNDYMVKLKKLNEINDEIKSRERESREKQDRLRVLKSAMIEYDPMPNYHVPEYPLKEPDFSKQLVRRLDEKRGSDFCMGGKSERLLEVT